MPDLPTGTLAFLFADIESSVRLWEQHAEAVPAALDRYEAILRETIHAGGGQVFKTVGDTFYAVFTSALEAVLAGVNIQRALGAQDWGSLGSVRARMALHWGPAEQRGDDYFGLTLNRVDRLLRIGYGGQVLLSEAMYDQVRQARPRDLDLRDLGQYYLREMSMPERIYQATSPDLPGEFPPLKTLDARLCNLPPQTTSFVGREREIDMVCALMRRPGVRLLTLTGSGGTGKTRLAIQAASQLLHEFEHGVFFVSLATINTVGLVAPAIAQTLNVRESPGEPLAESLKTYLRPRQMLLVLDNFEQVITIAPLVTELLAAAPQLRIMVTSRQVLRVYGEHEFVVPPLDLPDLAQLPPAKGAAQAASHFAAVELFVDRAQTSRPDFNLTDENALAVARICARLDGLPLAIELAAACCRTLSPQVVLARLGGTAIPSSLQAMTDRLGEPAVRQRTLRSAIDWSYNLLDVGEKQLFARLAVFSGGFTFEAMDVICNADDDLPMDMLDGVTSLLNKSIVQQAGRASAEPRFAMLETIRDYALERLQASGESDRLRQYHTVYYLTLAERAEPELHQSKQTAWLDRLEQEHGNLRAALEWSLACSEQETALRLSSALWQFWYWRGHLCEGRQWLEAALAQREHPVERERRPISLRHRARALHGAGVLASVQGHQARANLLLEESLALWRQIGDRGNIASVLTHLGAVAYDNQEYERAKQLHRESLEMSRAAGNQWNVASALNGLGEVARCEGDYATARICYESSLALRRELGNEVGMVVSLHNLGHVAHHQGDDDHALALYGESLRLAWKLGDRQGVAECLAALAGVAADRKQAVRAARLFGASQFLFERIGSALEPADRLEYDADVEAVRAALGEPAFGAAWGEGSTMTLEQASMYALRPEAQSPPSGETPDDRARETTRAN